MDTRELLALPARPESEFEWEDLLLRLELMPRALSVRLEDAGGVCPLEAIGEFVRRESFVNQCLERAATGAAGLTQPILAALPQDDAMIEDAAAGVDRFVRLRNRNFAMLQRRGIDVWDWRVEVEGSADVTVFQLLTLLARRDVELLGRLRNHHAHARSEC